MGTLRFVPAALLALLCARSAWVAGPSERAALRRTPIVEAVEKVRGAVVNISTEQIVVIRHGFGPFTGDDVFDRMFEEFFGRQYRRQPLERRKVNTPLGSGSVITANGLVVTNEHVIRRASNIKLSLHTGETFDAELLAADPIEDLALLRARVDHPLQAIPMGSSADLMLGEPVIALGNPFGFENSVTSGIVSALDREIEVGGQEGTRYSGLIQTSALINPGNSGGPLVNILGELIGINAAVVDQAQGIGFSIPIDKARDVLAPLLQTPRVSEAWPGFKGETTEKRDGVRVTEIEPDGDAAKRLRPGDIIREADGVPVADLFDFLLRVVQHKPGDAIPLGVERNGKTQAVTLALGRVKAPQPEKTLRERLGVQAQDLTPVLARQLGLAVEAGVLIAEVVRDSPAARVGLQQGDVIVQLGARPVRTVQDAAAALRDARAGQRVFLRIVRGQYSARTWITLSQ